MKARSLMTYGALVVGAATLGGCDYLGSNRNPDHILARICDPSDFNQTGISGMVVSVPVKVADRLSFNYQAVTDVSGNVVCHVAQKGLFKEYQIGNFTAGKSRYSLRSPSSKESRDAKDSDALTTADELTRRAELYLETNIDAFVAMKGVLFRHGGAIAASEPYNVSVAAGTSRMEEKESSIDTAIETAAQESNTEDGKKPLTGADLNARFGLGKRTQADEDREETAVLTGKDLNERFGLGPDPQLASRKK